MNSDSDMEQFLDSDTEMTDTEMADIERQFLDSDTEMTDTEMADVERQFLDSDTETSESDEEAIENIQKRNRKNFRRNIWKGRNNKRIVETGVNSEGNYYTVFTDGSYRYDNSDGYHYKNSNGKSVLFIISKCLKIGFRQHIHSKRHP